MNKTKEHIREMKCPLCTKCYEMAIDDQGKVYTGKCVYGGPYWGFTVDKDYDLSLLEIKG